MTGKMLHGGLDIEPFDFRMVIILSGNVVPEVSLPSTGFNVDGVPGIGDDCSFILVSELSHLSTLDETYLESHSMEFVESISLLRILFTLRLFTSLLFSFDSGFAKSAVDSLFSHMRGNRFDSYLTNEECCILCHSLV